MFLVYQYRVFSWFKSLSLLNLLTSCSRFSDDYQCRNKWFRSTCPLELLFFAYLTRVRCIYLSLSFYICVSLFYVACIIIRVSCVWTSHLSIYQVAALHSYSLLHGFCNVHSHFSVLSSLPFTCPCTLITLLQTRCLCLLQTTQCMNIGFWKRT